MSEELLDDLKSQLSQEGIESPEALEVDPRGMQHLTPQMTCGVSGGFEEVGFGQGFGQTTSGDFTQTYFLQQLHHTL
jgi:hypothetical protein